MSRLDVVVPCYNYARYLEACVRSVVADQPGVDLRVLIIDDCSTDETEAIGRRLAQGDSRIAYRRHATNHGHIATYNEGLLGWATAEYSLLLSADDYLVPDALQHAVRLLDAEPRVTLCYGRAYLVGDRAEQVPPVERREIQSLVLPGATFLDYVCSTGGNPVPTPAAVVRTELQQRTGGYDRQLPHSGDLAMWMRCALHGDIAVLSAPLACKRQHGHNMSGSFPGLSDLREIEKAYLATFSGHGRHAAAAPFLLAHGRERIAWIAFWAGVRQFESGNRGQAAECCAYAAELFPRIRRTRPWRRHRIRRMLGARVSRLLASRLRRGEGQERRGAGTPGPAPTVIGWWPGRGPTAAQPAGREP